MEINLLPWREEILAYNKKFFIHLMIATLILSALLLTFIYRVFFSDIIYSKTYLRSLEKEKVNLTSNINALSSFKKTETEISARYALLHQLTQNRFSTVLILNEIAKLTPTGVYLTKIVRKGNQIDIFGVANSNLLIIKMMQSITQSTVLKSTLLNKVEKTEGQGLIITKFDMQLNLKDPYAQKTKTEESKKNDAGILNKPADTILQMRQEQEQKTLDLLKSR